MKQLNQILRYAHLILFRPKRLFSIALWEEDISRQTAWLITCIILAIITIENGFISEAYHQKFTHFEHLFYLAGVSLGFIIFYLAKVYIAKILLERVSIKAKWNKLMLMIAFSYVSAIILSLFEILFPLMADRVLLIFFTYFWSAILITIGLYTQYQLPLQRAVLFTLFIFGFEGIIRIIFTDIPI